MVQNPNPLTVYTALFNINRESVDGRTLSQYKLWLAETVKLFPKIIIFHDGSIKRTDLPGNTCKLVKIEKSNLPFFRLAKPLQKLLKVYHPQAKNDITFLLPTYSLVQYSKFSLAINAIEISKAKSLLWVDAGISRFIKHVSQDRLERNSIQLLKKNYLMALEIDLKNNFNLKSRLKNSEIGSSKRVVSGTSFWINALYVESLNIKICEMAHLWLNEGIWDNEQVMLRRLELWKDERIFLFDQGLAKTGQVANKLSNSNFNKLELLSSLFNKMVK